MSDQLGLFEKNTKWLTLDGLREDCVHCQNCTLSQRRTNVVFGEGNPQANLVIVGEGPGAQEDESGRPFVGRAGKMLDRGLVDAGLNRKDDIYICNTVKCRAANWETGKPQNRPPTPEETAECKNWLVPQLAMINPMVILCVGAPSAKNLLKKDFKITKERGLLFETEFAKAGIATLHPAYILRQQRHDFDGGYSLFVEDIKKAWDTAQKLHEKFGGQS